MNTENFSALMYITRKILALPCRNFHPEYILIESWSHGNSTMEFDVKMHARIIQYIFRWPPHITNELHPPENRHPEWHKLRLSLIHNSRGRLGRVDSGKPSDVKNSMLRSAAISQIQACPYPPPPPGLLTILKDMRQIPGGGDKKLTRENVPQRGKKSGKGLS
jgi:hypothetical protein